MMLRGDIRRLPEPALLIITDRMQARRPLEAIAEACFAGGCRWLSLREKDLDARERAALLARLIAIGKRHDAVVTVHDDIDAAAECGAHGVHLPGGVSPEAARHRLGPAALIGCSAHDRRELSALAAAGADYATLSPIFASAGKPGYGPALGIDALAGAAAASPLPLIALGGIDGGNAARCIAAGAAGVAVMGSVMTAADPAAMLRTLITSLGAGLAAPGGAGHSGAI
ncbi:MAG TPA: thiamine phosphate synthase [Stellaceae bacterium]|nr:thiamine phosphate synthase [Stellaceae bacterium]